MLPFTESDSSSSFWSVAENVKTPISYCDVAVVVKFDRDRSCGELKTPVDSVQQRS